ncbi:MAG: FAD-dependent monooxygenase [Phycisphaerales bacterium]|nr:FAD-dependent monooxygenase [Phycisphaerales bacterium]
MASENRQPCVLICGAGPVGLALATQLARHDIDFRIIDRNESRTELSKALVIFARSLELLHTGVDAHSFIDAGTEMECAQLFAGGRPLAVLPLKGTDSPFGTGIMLPQARTEQILEESLDAMGHTVERCTELTDFTDLGDRVRCTIRGPGGEETIEPAWLAGCDGAHSIVRHGLDLEFKGSSVQDRWILADCHVKGIDPAATIIPSFNHEGMLVLFRIKGDRFRVTANTPLNNPEQPRVDPTLEEIQDILDRRGAGQWHACDPTWLTEFRINERMIDHFRHGRCLLAGDAAHIHSPAGGQGMNTGMQDACNLAWKLALVHKGVASDALLDSYSDERSEIGRQLLVNTGRMLRTATLRSRITSGLRNTAIRFAMKRPKLQARFRNFLSELSISYPADSIGGSDHAASHDKAAPGPGHRVPDLAMTSQHGVDSLHDQLADPRFSLLLHIETEDGLEQVATIENAIPHAWRSSIQVLKIMSSAPHPTGSFLHAEEADLEHRIGLPRGTFALVRPDGYLLLRGTAMDPAPLVEWCRRFTGPNGTG